MNYEPIFYFKFTSILRYNNYWTSGIYIFGIIDIWLLITDSKSFEISLPILKKNWYFLVWPVYFIWNAPEFLGITGIKISIRCMFSVFIFDLIFNYRFQTHIRKVNYRILILSTELKIIGIFFPMNRYLKCTSILCYTFIRFFFWYHPYSIIYDLGFRKISIFLVYVPVFYFKCIEIYFFKTEKM